MTETALDFRCKGSIHHRAFGRLGMHSGLISVRDWDGQHLQTTEMYMATKAAAAKPSKHDMLLKLLRSKSGTTVVAMQKATGWQPHSIRGFMSGTVKKKLGLTVISTVSASGQRKYAIARQ